MPSHCTIEASSSKQSLERTIREFCFAFLPFPSVENERKLRPENQYINQTFTLAAPNLSINGFDLDASTFPAVYLSDDQHAQNNNNNNSTGGSRRSRRGAAAAAAAAEQPIIQYEPFDARKRARVEELAREEEDLMREIAALKRRVPGAAARTYADGFWDAVRADEAALEAARARAALVWEGGEEDVEEGGGGKRRSKRNEDDDDDNNNKGSGRASMLEGLGTIDRVDDVERGYAGVVDALSRLKRDMPATVAKMERARVAGEYVITER